MKDKLKQIKFVDQILLPIYGIKDITDYQSKVSLNDLKKNPNILLDLNKHLDVLKENFHAKDFNFHKTNNKVQTLTQAMGILKKCLEATNIMYEIINISKINHLRLIPKNNILDQYINMKKTTNFSEIRENKTELMQNLKKIEYSKILKNLSDETVTEVFIPLLQVLRSDNSIFLNANELEVYQYNIKSIEIGFQLQNTEVNHLVTNDKLNELLCNGKYRLDINGQTFHNSTLEQNKNILPDNILLPFTYTVFCQPEIYIYKESELNKFITDILGKFILIKVKITHVKIDEKIMENLTTNKYYFEMETNDHILEISKQFISVKSKTPSDEKNENNEIIGKEILKENDIDGTEIMIGDKKCLKLNAIVKGHDSNIEGIKGLVLGYYATIQYTTDVSLGRKAYTEKNSKYTFKHTFYRNCDLIDNLSITFPFIIESLSIKLEKSSQKISPYLAYVHDGNNMRIIHINLCKKRFNMAGNPYGLSIIFEIDNCYNMIELFEKTYLSYDAYLVNDKTRRILTESQDDFVIEQDNEINQKNILFTEKKLIDDIIDDIQVKITGIGKSLPMKHFDLDNMCQNPSICMVAKRLSGKTWITMNILNKLKDSISLKDTLIMSKTDKTDKLYSKLYPEAKILYDYVPEVLDEYLAYQTKRIECVRNNYVKLYKPVDLDNDDYRNYMQKSCAGAVILDDCLGSKGTWMNDKSILELFYNSKQYYTTFIITMQFPLGIKPELRSNFDYVFLLSEDFFSNQKRMYDHYAGMFPSFEIFRTVFLQLTDDYGSMVIVNKGNIMELTDKVLYFKASDPFEKLK